jgi:hypothetical protein
MTPNPEIRMAIEKKGKQDDTLMFSSFLTEQKEHFEPG